MSASPAHPSSLIPHPSPIESAIRSVTRPPAIGPCWQWCDEFVPAAPGSNFGNRFSSDVSPWVRPVMEACQDNAFRHVMILKSNQSSGTELVTAFTHWLVVNDPGDTIWLQATKPEVRDFMKTRLLRQFAECKPIAALLQGLDRHSKTTYDIIFNHMVLRGIWAGGEAALQQKKARYGIADEYELYENTGAVEDLEKRQTTFWNRRNIIVSRAGEKDADMHRRWKLTDQREWHFPCKSCGHFQPLVWRRKRDDRTEYGLMYEVPKIGNRQSEIGNEDSLNMDRVAATIRYTCVKCGHAHPDHPEIRSHFEHRGKFIAANTDASSDQAGFRWNALLPHWIQWRTLVDEWIKANFLKRRGYIEPLKKFLKGRAVDFWDPEFAETPEFEDVARTPYEIRSAWPDEIVRFLAVDVQKDDNFWYVCRAFAADGRSRYIDSGQLIGYEAIAAKQSDLKVPAPCVILDARWKTAEVYRQCKQRNWRADMACKEKYFTEKDKKHPGRFVRTVWRFGRIDPFKGTRLQDKFSLKVIMWSKDSVMDMMALYLKGKAQEWQVPSTAPKNYVEQIASASQRRRIDPRGNVILEWHYRKDFDHMLLREVAILVAAMVHPKIEIRQPFADASELLPSEGTPPSAAADE